ncbi:CDP-glycerol glycerophosphotransferase family protein, partial [Proteus mirabilis]|nr:CDP-glycerol glycerophosphotransferase family protein [Proteus mirabilis]
KMNKHFKESFKLEKKNILEGYYPRCNLLNMEKTLLQNFIENNEPPETINLIKEIKNYNEVFIYMPTWRENNKNFLDNFLFHLGKLNENLKQKNKLLLLKLHPRTPSINKNSINHYSNLILLNNKTDIYPILPFTDTLITDYSSIYYDYILMKEKRIIFFIPDYNSYIKYRDLAFDYFSSIKGDVVYDLNELLNKIICDNHYDYNYDNIIKDFWGISDDKRDIHKAIIKILKNKYNEK